MTPRFVVPADATTAKTRCSPRDSTESRARASASPCRRCSWSTSTVTRSTSITSAASWSDEWASGLTAIAQRRDSRDRPPDRSRTVWRAVTSAERLALVPPCTKVPPAPGGKPGEVGDPPQRLVLGVDGAGSFEPVAPAHRRGADDEVEQHRCLGGGARDEGEEARVAGGDAGRREHLGEDP